MFLISLSGMILFTVSCDGSLQNNNREHIQLKQSVRLVGLEESHIDKRALAEQGMERCVGPSLEVVLLCMVLNHKVMLLN
ncbi:hypothetical protein POPTR_006G270501v4 [Populus trichocarpa]|uniref:Uncharacterized protein n=1 Tax=Populus trichocarpa TaxID=3694 RepID=A0ACC0SX37_POPTR|nr:hypothetical protein BDE02_11G010500 [Populus trichocarpa]KAI5586981.1 hypothetical protein BDE02_06G248000 [Populus trichocarpa]KAI9393797.1 hypothetical protein POPTR_006G270501v4 [Populus trichocarpa]